MSCCIIISCTKNIHSKNRSFSRIKYLVLKSLLVALRSNDSIFYNSLTPLLENTQMECNCVGDDWMNGIAKLFHVAPHSQPKGAATTTNPISSKSSIPIEPPQNLQTFATLWWRNLPMSYYPRIMYKFQTLITNYSNELLYDHPTSKDGCHYLLHVISNENIINLHTCLV